MGFSLVLAVQTGAPALIAPFPALVMFQRQPRATVCNTAAALSRSHLELQSQNAVVFHFPTPQFPHKPRQ